ncbi:hypothetical protein DN595_27490 [Enterobacter cloacae]|uniref:Uncharacterized protein n=1 Tax=Enterobacter cloacae TaxID=550 RepID=A0AB37VB39_ENTCL|nr:hypothetical protein DN595_27490 [Enterobacter cloacae]
MGSCAAPSAKGDDKFITTDYLQQCRTVYSGNSRFVAWTFWLMNRHRRAIAYDCGVWVVEPAYWIRVV